MRRDSSSSSSGGSGSDSHSSDGSADASTSGSVSSTIRSRSRSRGQRLDNKLSTLAALSVGVQRAFLRRSLSEYEGRASAYLLLMLLAHVPYLLLLFALKDPLQLGISIHVAKPVPYPE